MVYTETTHESYFSRIGGAFKGILAGLVLMVAGIALLFWNEGRTVHRTKALAEGYSSVVSVDSAAIDPANEGKLVHLTGTAKTAETLSDPDFSVSVPAILLARDVEMYQWSENASSETKKKIGGGTETVTTYTYEKTWAPFLIDSSAFKESGHENPAAMPYQSADWYAKNVTLGPFTLSESLIKRIGPEEDYSLDAPHSTPNEPMPVEPAPSETAPSEPAPSESTPSENTATAITQVAYFAQSETISVPAPAIAPETPLPGDSDAVPSADTAQSEGANGAKPGNRTLFGGGFYLGTDPQTPKIGDLRVTYRFVRPEQEISLISQQSGSTFVPYQAKTGSVELLASGNQSADQMFAAAKSENKFFAMVLRILGFFVLFFGLNAVFKPLSVLADVLPFLGSMVGYGVGFFSFLIALAISLATISVAWLYYRPLVGIPLLIASIAVLIFAFRKKPARPTP